MKKISWYLWVVAGMCVFVVCMLLFVGGIEDQKIDDANKPLIDNKANISSENKFSEPASNNLNNKEADNVYENMKPEGSEIEIKLGAKVDVNETHIPKEKLIEAIVSGGKKVTEEDMIVIAKELNISVIELKKEIENSKTQLSE